MTRAKGGTVVFSEVKTRRTDAYGSPAEAVTVSKQRKLRALAGRWLEELVRVSTAPVVRDRPRDAREFLDYLAEAEKEALPAEPAPATTADPATAGPGDRLDGDLIVKRRLGRGGSANVLLVAREEALRLARFVAPGVARDLGDARPDGKKLGNSLSRAA